MDQRELDAMGKLLHDDYVQKVLDIHVEDDGIWCFNLMIDADPLQCDESAPANPRMTRGQKELAELLNQWPGPIASNSKRRPKPNQVHAQSSCDGGKGTHVEYPNARPR